MTRKQVKDKYLIKTNGETIECFNVIEDNIITTVGDKIFLININEFEDIVVLDKQTLQNILKVLS